MLHTDVVNWIFAFLVPVQRALIRSSARVQCRRPPSGAILGSFAGMGLKAVVNGGSWMQGSHVGDLGSVFFFRCGLFFLEEIFFLS